MYISSNPEVAGNMARTFRRNFPNLMVSIQILSLVLPNEEEMLISDERNEMILRSLNICERYINIIGPGIDRMTIDFVGLNRNTSQRLNELIVSARNLIEIRFIGMQEVLIDGRTRFPYVKKVHIVDSDLQSEIRFFSSSLFPNARTFKMENVRLNDCRAYFEHLEHFSIKSNSLELGYNLRHATKLWIDSENLQTLEIDMSGDSGMLLADLLDTINTESLSILSIITEIKLANVTRREINDLIERHPDLVKLHLYSYMVSMVDVIYMIDKLTSLKYFAYQKTLGDSWNENEEYIENLQLALEYNWQVRVNDDLVRLLRNV